MNVRTEPIMHHPFARQWRRFAVAFALVIFFHVATRAARGQDLFSLTATGTSGGGTTTVASAGGNNVINLVKNLTNDQGPFTTVGNENYSGSLTYAGIKNAVTLGQTKDNSGNQIVTLKVPSIGLTHVFNSANGSITDQVRDYLKSEGLADLAAFQNFVNRSTPVGEVDGNPMAFTSMMTDAGYFQLAAQRGEGEANGGKFTSADGRGQSYYWASGGTVDAGGISGDYVDFTLGSQYQFNDVLGLSLTSPGRWLTLRGANIFMGGFILGLPISIIPGNDDGRGHNDGLSWRVTPAGQVGAAGSADFAAGALLYGGQLDSSLSISGGGFTFTLAETAAYFHGADITIADYHFSTDLDQWVFKNGIVVTKSWRGLALDAGAAWTNFLHATYVDGYLSPEAGVSLRFGYHDNSGIRVGYEGNFGRGYSSNGGNVLLYITN
jgi:hypothetical protein